MGERKTPGVVGWPWWTHQGLEYLLALLLVSEAAHAEIDRVALGGLGLGLAVFAGVTEGPLGILGWLSVGLHRALDFLVVAILITAPVLIGLHAVIGIITVESAGLVLLWVTLHTRANSKPRQRTTTTTPVSATAVADAPTSHIAYRVGRAIRRSAITDPRDLGRAVGRLSARYRSEGRR